MGKIVVSTNVTLDGVFEDPDGKEGAAAGGWFRGATEADLAAWAASAEAEAHATAALLLGRRSDAWFAARWTHRAGTWADRLAALPKYVVSASTTPPAWTNAHVVGGDVAAAVAQVSARTDGDVVVYGSARLVSGLVALDLVDELRLVVFPVVAGGGRRLVEDAGPARWQLVEVGTLGEGLVRSVHRRAGSPTGPH